METAGTKHELLLDASGTLKNDEKKGADDEKIGAAAKGKGAKK